MQYYGASQYPETPPAPSRGRRKPGVPPGISPGGTAPPAPGGGAAGTIGPPTYPPPGGGTGGDTPNPPSWDPGPPPGYPPRAGSDPSGPPNPTQPPPQYYGTQSTVRPEETAYTQNVRPDDATARGAQTTTTGTKAPAPTKEAPESRRRNQDGDTGGSGGDKPPGYQPPGDPLPGSETGGGGGPEVGTAWGGRTSTEGTGLGDEYESEDPPGGLVGYYTGKMGSTGMSEAERNALEASTMTPIQQQAQQAKDAMMRVRAATGNDAGLYAGLSETGRAEADSMAQQGRQNSLQNEQIRRAEQAEGAGGNLNLYGQTQAETIEYLRMLGNLLGRQEGSTSYGNSKGSDFGIQYTPGM